MPPVFTTSLQPAMKYLVILITLLSLTLLYLLSSTSSNHATYHGYYPQLLTLNIVLVIGIVALIVMQLSNLIGNLRRKVIGSHFNLRLLIFFSLMVIIPALIIYFVSVNFLTRSIESWFNVRVETALEGGVNLGQTAMDIMLDDLKEKGENIATTLSLQPSNMGLLNELRERIGVEEMTLLTPQGKILAVAGNNTLALLPSIPSLTDLRRVQLHSITSVRFIRDKGLYLRVLIPVTTRNLTGETRILQLLQHVPYLLANTTINVQNIYKEYQKLSLGRNALKQVFAITLTVVTILAILCAITIALLLSRHLSAPLTALAEGTRAISEGRYNVVLPEHSKDELGSLLTLFNDMAQRLERATNAESTSRYRAEVAREYVETILSHLSSGVLAISPQNSLRTFNNAAEHILGISLSSHTDHDIMEIATHHIALKPFFSALLSRTESVLPTQIELEKHLHKQILTLQGTHLPDGGYVVVFDDVTTMIQAQRDAAWGEVARRLAHEIKNPLTPIQLSAERLAHKLKTKLDSSDANILQRATNTIVTQVTAMKKMVNEFGEYARPISTNTETINFNQLIDDVLVLYQPSSIHIETHLEHTHTYVRGNSTQLRQVLHNILQNAQDALESQVTPKITISTMIQNGYVQLLISDNGEGFPPDTLQRAFDPYVTTKPHGTGLGLAIVKKIIDEHNGTITIANCDGARITIQLPLSTENTT